MVAVHDVLPSALKFSSGETDLHPLITFTWQQSSRINQWHEPAAKTGPNFTGAFEKQGLRSAHDHPSATHVGTPLAKRLRSFAGRGRGAWRVGQFFEGRWKDGGRDVACSDMSHYITVICRNAVSGEYG